MRWRGGGLNTNMALKSLTPVNYGTAEQISLGLLGIQRVVVVGVGVVVVNNVVVVVVELVDLTIP